jgi:hypothetical protein
MVAFISEVFKIGCKGTAIPIERQYLKMMKSPEGSCPFKKKE